MKYIYVFLVVLVTSSCGSTQYITHNYAATDSTARIGTILQNVADTLVFTHYQRDTLIDSVRVIRAHHTHTVDTVRQVQYVTFSDTTSKSPAPAPATISKLDIVAAQVATLLVIGVIISFFIVIFKLVVFKSRP